MDYILLLLQLSSVSVVERPMKCAA